MKSRRLILSQIAISVIVLTSCGVNTKGWPRFEFEFEAKEIDSLILNYRCKKSKKNEYFDDTLTFFNEDSIESVMELIAGVPYKQKCEKKVDRKNYSSKVILDFTFLDKSIESQTIEFYSYGISNGKIVFSNGEIHYSTANIGAFYTDASTF